MRELDFGGGVEVLVEDDRQQPARMLLGALVLFRQAFEVRPALAAEAEKATAGPPVSST